MPQLPDNFANIFKWPYLKKICKESIQNYQRYQKEVVMLAYEHTSTYIPNIVQYMHATMLKNNKIWKMVTMIVFNDESGYILKEQGLAPVDFLRDNTFLFRVPPFHLPLFQHRRLKRQTRLRQTSEIMLTRIIWRWRILQTIRQTKLKLMKETDAVRCDNKENGKEERHHSTKQRHGEEM